MPQKRRSSIGWVQVATRWDCLSGISLSKIWWIQGSLQLLGAGPPGAELGFMRMGGVGPEDRPGFEEGKSKRSRTKVTWNNRRCSKGGVHTQQREQRSYAPWEILNTLEEHGARALFPGMRAFRNGTTTTGPVQEIRWRRRRRGRWRRSRGSRTKNAFKA